MVYQLKEALKEAMVDAKQRFYFDNTDDEEYERQTGKLSKLINIKKFYEKEKVQDHRMNYPLTLRLIKLMKQHGKIEDVVNFFDSSADDPKK